VWRKSFEEEHKQRMELEDLYLKLLEVKLISHSLKKLDQEREIRIRVEQDRLAL